jgi:hypothetical protein
MVNGRLGGNSVDALLIVTMQNPCINNQYLTVQPIVISDVEYTLFQTQRTWSHNDFTI